MPHIYSSLTPFIHLLALPLNNRLSAGRKIKQENLEFYHQRSQLLEGADTITEVTSFPASQIAVQLTLIEHRLFQNIAPNEFFFGNWKRPNKESLCPNIVAMISWFNRITDWIITEIVTGLSVKRRVKTLKKFIKIAAVLHSLYFSTPTPH